VLVEASDALWDPLVDWTTNGIGGPVEGAVEPDGGTPISREIPGGRTNAYFRLRVLWED
jgi:hypothetical protein